MIEVWSEMPVDRAESLMPQEILTRLAHHVSRHPWWLARARLVSRLIAMRMGPAPQRVLDVGCGWGVTLDHLERAGHHVTGMDIGRAGLEKLDKPDRRLILGDIERGPIPQTARGAFDVVLALDVLEHLDDDMGALRNLASLARPGGLVVVTVPARPDLWSEFDDIQRHKRRYLKHGLEKLFAQAIPGAADSRAEVRVGYCWPWMTPLARWTRRRVRRDRAPGLSDAEIYERYVRPPAWPARQLIERLFRWSEAAILAGGQRDGTSLLAWARLGEAAPH